MMPIKSNWQAIAPNLHTRNSNARTRNFTYARHKRLQMRHRVIGNAVAIRQLPSRQMQMLRIWYT